ncbi:MAG: TIGR03986 family CRISPR-associated RAMP protein [Thermodesulfovibrionales bacterium]
MNLEKAKMIVENTKKGFAVKIIISESKKTIPITDMKLPDDKLNGKDVDIYREKGQVKKILFEGKPIYDKTTSTGAKDQNIPAGPPRVDRNQRYSSTTSSVDIATAPYNFVPLNDTVVPAEEIPALNTYYSDRYTGCIDLEIKALTPLYIRDTLTLEEYKEKVEHEKSNKKEPYSNSSFFSPGGIVRIPGSSLRGMIRTMVEIVSFGKFGFFENKRLYYRGLADLSWLRKEYQKHMSSFDKNSKKSTYKMSAGYLYKDGLRYYIQPAKDFGQINKNEAKELIKEGYKTFTYHKVADKYIVVSGDMQNKKRDWFIAPPDERTTPIQLLPEDIEDYKNDSGRHKDVPNLLTLASKDKVPCFYTRYSDEVGRERISFGHTAMFRLAYKKTVGDHIPSYLKDESTIDIAHAIFGNEKTFAGRVFFEDALCEGNGKDVLMSESVPKILSTPKPTTFQHYLEQTKNNLVNHPRNLAHYNSNTAIRGYKLYWHRDANNWIEKDEDQINKHISQYTKITPVKEGTTFKGRIRFENLTKVELGALLFVLDLPEGLAHKLGMGKPLGLGSVKITPRLYLSDRRKRYTELFAEWDGMSEATPQMAEFKKGFEKYILRYLKNKEQSLWHIDRVKILGIMLNWANKPSNQNTEYMQLEEFRKRSVLPSPKDVINNSKP